MGINHIVMNVMVNSNRNMCFVMYMASELSALTLKHGDDLYKKKVLADSLTERSGYFTKESKNE